MHWAFYFSHFCMFFGSRHVHLKQICRDALSFVFNKMTGKNVVACECVAQMSHQHALILEKHTEMAADIVNCQLNICNRAKSASLVNTAL